MHENLSVSERRSIAGLASLLYLTLIGYKAAVPQFAVSHFPQLKSFMNLQLFIGNWIEIVLKEDHNLDNHVEFMAISGIMEYPISVSNSVRFHVECNVIA